MARAPKQQRLKQVVKSKRAESVEVMHSLRRDADLIAKQFQLRYKELAAEKTSATGHYGICYDDGTIRIRLRHARSGKLLRYSSLVNTLCHELAHLKYFDHGENFKRFYFQILSWARQQGIYQPAKTKAAPVPTPIEVNPSPLPKRETPRPLPPRQLSLF